MAVSAARPALQPAPAPRLPAAKKLVLEPPPPAPRSRRPLFIAAALVVVALLSAVGIGYKTIQGNYYVTAYNDSVAIMRGIQGSFLGVPLQKPFLLGCLSDRNVLSQISPDQADSQRDCKLFAVGDLRPSERAQVMAGLPAGTLDSAISQLNELSHVSLLPICAPPPAPKPTPTPTPAAKPTTVPRSGPTTSAPPTSVSLPAPQQKPGVDCRAAT